MSCKIYLKTGKGQNALSGHPWIYSGEIEGYDGEYENGDIVSVFTAESKFIGQGFINDMSKIAIRLMTRNEEDEINEDFIRNRMLMAYEYRKNVIDTSSCRIVFGEADFLPGLTVDKYEDYYVLQSLALGMEQFKPMVVKILMEDFKAKGVYERSDAKVRELEGLEQTTGFLTEAFDTMVMIQENGVKYMVDLANGQKTGFFLDQKENRKAIHKLCQGKDVLDCFTHTGSFALNAGIAGAKSVIGIDVSEHAVECARKNAELNNLQDKVTFLCENAFDLLPKWSFEGKQFDVVILDPPAFTKSKDTVKGAQRGYKEINLRGIKMVKPGGFLISCSCSHFMTEELFKEAIASAAKDAKRTIRQVEFRTQGPDHPILWSKEESYYLKFYILQVI